MSAQFSGWSTFAWSPQAMGSCSDQMKQAFLPKRGRRRTQPSMSSALASHRTLPRPVARLLDGSRGFAAEGTLRDAIRRVLASTMDSRQPGVQSMSQVKRNTLRLPRRLQLNNEEHLS